MAVAVLAGMIAFGTSDPPPYLASISEPFGKVDFHDLPPVQTTPARDGTPIAFRVWQPLTRVTPGLIVIAIHGSSASSASLHALGKALNAEPLVVYAPDIRGHGGTGRRSDIDYADQLDDDLADFVAFIRQRHPAARLVLVGFSSGGGFALHAAAMPVGAKFERVVLISPFLGPGAPTVRTRGDAWAKPFLPRIFGLLFLDKLGVHVFDHLPTLAFAIAPDNPADLTRFYSFRLMRAFGTWDYAGDLRGARAPLAVVVGAKDELFFADLFAPTVHAVRIDVPVTVVPDLDHIEMITDPRAVPAIAAAIRGSS
ncbi:MAG: alpha/beta fold hydrolase [Hyphomicrobiales bacterium]|nr:alpha/beta fold hydrolase [Hyphomicrobiales bacterium]MBV8827374.1 alpha/beta fold hydrolase [Hyphomicrobiales bacterium]